MFSIALSLFLSFTSLPADVKGSDRKGNLRHFTVVGSMLFKVIVDSNAFKMLIIFKNLHF